MANNFFVKWNNQRMNYFSIKRGNYTTSFYEHFIQMKILKEVVQILGIIPFKIFYKQGCIMRPSGLFIIMNLSHTAAPSYCNAWMITAYFVMITYLYHSILLQAHFPLSVGKMVNHIPFATQVFLPVYIFSIPLLQSYYLSNIPLICLSKSESIRWVLLKMSYSLSAFALACAAEMRPLSGNI